MSKDILIYTENHVVGGANRYLIDLINSIPEIYNVYLVVNEGALFPSDLKLLKRNAYLKYLPIWSWQNSSLRNKISSNIIRKIIHVFLLPFWFLRNCILFDTYLRANTFSKVIIVNGGYPGAYSCLHFSLISIIKQLSTYMIVLSMPTERKILSGCSDLLWDIFLNKNLKKLITNSRTQMLSFSSIRGFNPQSVGYIYNPIRTASLEKISQCDNTNSSVTKFLFMGRLEEAKGMNDLINAFTQCVKKKSYLTLDIVGTGNISFYAKMIKDLNVESNIKLLGYLDQANEDIFRNYDCFVFPSLWEGLPYVILDAINCGIPVIATDVGAVSEVIENNVSGILIPPGDINALVHSILKISTNKNWATNMKLNAFESVSRKFSTQKFNEQVHDKILK